MNPVISNGNVQNMNYIKLGKDVYYLTKCLFIKKMTLLINHYSVRQLHFSDLSSLFNECFLLHENIFYCGCTLKVMTFIYFRV